MTDLNDGREFADLIYAGFGLLSRLAGAAAILAVLALAVGLTVAPQWVMPAFAGTLALGGTSVLLHVVSGIYRPEVGE